LDGSVSKWSNGRQVFKGFIAPKEAHWRDEDTAIHLNPALVLKIWILLICIEVIVGPACLAWARAMAGRWRQLGVQTVQVNFNVVRGSIASGRGSCFQVP